MSEKFYTILTNIGKAKIANSGVMGSKVNFVKFKIGDSNGSYYEPTEAQRDLIHTVYEGNITDIEVDKNNPNWIKINLMIPANVGGFTIREYGVFDESGNMLAVAKCAESYKPIAEDGSTKELILRMILAVSNTSSVNMELDPTLVFVSKDELEKVRQELTLHLKDLDKDSYPIVEATGTNAYIGASARIKAVGKGTRCTLFVGTASNGNCSLNLNNSGAAAIKDSNGNVVTNMKANIPYNLCHNGSDFILQGKGGGGNLIPKYLLAGYYGEGDNGRVDGAMVNRGAPTSNLNCGGVVNLQEGYYAGGQIMANSLASQTGGATADDTKVLNGYKYWKDGVLRTGNATIQSLGGMPIEKYTFTKSTAYGTEEYFKFGSNIANTIYGKHIVIDVGNGYWTNIYADGVAKDYYLRSGSSSNTYGSGSAIKLLPDEDKVQFKMDKYTNVGVTIDLLVINIYI